ncbi:MAG: hypothetical protein JW836_10100 [Deltaproteobacteria bacterium]|nr:hypothetical protein [Deltaproteobacteria bacterium]
MKKKRDGLRLPTGMVLFVFALWAVLLFPGGAMGDEKEKKDLPPRAIEVAPEYTGVIVPVGDDVSVDLTVANKGRKDEFIDLSLTQIPEGWTARIKTYSFDVTGVYLGSDKSKSLTLKAEPKEGTGPGKYTFGIQGRTQDGELVSNSKVTITTTAKVEEKKAKGVNLNTSYPVLQGPTDAKFEFSVEVENKTDKDSIFNLSAAGPANWELNFKPAYEDKFISSLRLKERQSQSVALEVKPYLMAEAGNYPITVKVSSPDARAEAELTVVLTGTYKMDIGTPTGLLSLTAMRGEPSNVSFYVKNSGSAVQNNLRFMSVKPENWKVEFKPEKIETLPPGETKQIEMTVSPAAQALVGDYSLNVMAEGERTNKNLEFRVSVKASSVWGWIGIGIIVLVLLGLVGLFVYVGRR